MSSADAGPFPVHDHDGVAVIELTGDVDAGAERAMDAAWDAAVADEPRAVAVDFARVGYINSTGIALLVGLLTKARARDLPLRASGLDAHYREIFAITRLADFMEIDDENGAVAAYERGAADE